MILELKNKYSFRCFGIDFLKGSSLRVDDKVAKKILKKYPKDFVVIPDAPVTIEEVKDEKGPDYAKMTKAELLKIAEEKGLNLDNKATKDAIIKALEE